MSTDVDRRRRLMLTASGVDAAALGLYLASAGVYLATVVGLGASTVGVVLGLGGGAAMVAAVPIARLTERHEPARVLAWLLFARGLAFVLCAVAGTSVVAAAVVAAAGCLNRAITPIIQAVALDGSDDAGQVDVLAKNRALRNAGIALGGIPVGFVLSAGSASGFRVLFLVAGVLAAAAALLASRLPPSSVPTTSGDRPRGRVPRGFVVLTVVAGAMTTTSILIGLGIPLIVVSSSGVPAWTVGFVPLVNTVLVVSLQVVFSRGSERVPRARAMLSASGAVAALGCLLLIVVPQTSGGRAVALVVLAVLVLTMAQLLASAGGAGLMLTWIPAGRRARHLAVFHLGFAGATIVGPPVVGAAVTHRPIGWVLTAAAFAVLSILAVRLPAGTRHP